MERRDSEVVAETSERMKIAVARAQPIDEFDAQLERAFGGADEIVFIDVQQLVEQLNDWNGRLADADDADFLRFDERDLEPLGRERLGQRRRRHPTCGAAAGDDNVADRIDHAACARQKRSMKASWVGIVSAARASSPLRSRNIRRNSSVGI